MTSTEAKQKVEACEQQIVSTYGELKKTAKAVGDSAASSASSKTTVCTLIPLILCVIGIIGIYSVPYRWYVGALLIVAGLFIAYKLHSYAKRIQNSIRNGQSSLNYTIDGNKDI